MLVTLAQGNDDKNRNNVGMMRDKIVKNEYGIGVSLMITGYNGRFMLHIVYFLV